MSEPGGSGEPGEPGAPGELGELGAPSELSELSELRKPSELGELSGPGELREPSRPGELREPSRPGELRESSGPGELCESAELAEPGESAELAEPGELSELREPSGPGEPYLPFFVYGTLRPGEPNHARFLRGKVTTETPGLLADAVLYEGPGYPYAVESPGGGPVRGDLVSAPAEGYPALLATLDRLEDHTPGDPYGDNDYERIARPVRPAAGGPPVRAWVYVAAPRVEARLRAHGTVIEGGDWLGRLSRPAPGTRARRAPRTP